jgi:uncharacterized membrane protein
MSWKTIAVVAIIAIAVGIGGFAGVQAYRKKNVEQ